MAYYWKYFEIQLATELPSLVDFILIPRIQAPTLQNSYFFWIPLGKPLCNYKIRNNDELIALITHINTVTLSSKLLSSYVNNLHSSIFTFTNLQLLKSQI